MFDIISVHSPSSVLSYAFFLSPSIGVTVMKGSMRHPGTHPWSQSCCLYVFYPATNCKYCVWTTVSRERERERERESTGRRAFSDSFGTTWLDIIRDGTTVGSKKSKSHCANSPRARRPRSFAGNFLLSRRRTKEHIKKADDNCHTT